MCLRWLETVPSIFPKWCWKICWLYHCRIRKNKITNEANPSWKHKAGLGIWKVSLSCLFSPRPDLKGIVLLIWSILNLDWHILSQTPVLFGFSYISWKLKALTFLHPGEYRQNRLLKFTPSKQKRIYHNWLAISTHLKNISQNGNLLQIGVKIKNIWNHHPGKKSNTKFVIVPFPHHLKFQNILFCDILWFIPPWPCFSFKNKNMGKHVSCLFVGGWLIFSHFSRHFTSTKNTILEHPTPVA